jgi:hypothetical protein
MIHDKTVKNSLIKHLDTIDGLVKSGLYQMDTSDLHQLDQFVFLDYLYFWRSHYFYWFIEHKLEDYFWTKFHENINTIHYNVKYDTEFNDRYREWKILKIDQILNTL